MRSRLRTHKLLTAGLVLAAVAPVAAAGPSGPRPVGTAAPPGPARSAMEARLQVHALDGRLPAGAQLAGFEQAARLRAAGGDLRWRQAGPAGFPKGFAGADNRELAAGRVSSLAIATGRSTTAYAGAASGGVWRTTDDGRSWTPVGDVLPTLAVGAVAVDPRRPRRVWVGTGEANEAGTSIGQGVFRSDDDGRTWQAATGDAPFRGCATSDLVVLPDAVLAVVLAASLQNDAVTGSRCPQPGVWRSTDSGRRWARTLPGHVQDVVRSREGALYAAGGGDVGVARSDDGGRTWRALPVGLPPQAVVRRAVVDVAPDGVVVAAFATPSGGLLGTWTSPDGGATWRLVPSASSPCGWSGSQEATGQCWYDLTLLAERGGTYLLGGVSLMRFRSDTGAAQEVGFGAVHVDQHALVRDARGRVWLGNDGGVYRSADGGARWAALNRGLAITQFNHGASVTGDGRVLAGTQDNGTLLREGATWQQVLGGDGGATVTHPKAPALAYASYQQMRPLRSRDGGATWIQVDTGLPPGEPRAFYAPLVGDPGDPRRLYTATTRVFRTDDAGELWLPASPPFEATITAVAVAPSDPRTIYAASSRGVRTTRDAGTTWLPSRTPWTARTATSLSVHPADPARAWVTLGGYGAAHVLETRDGGATWHDIGAGLPDLPVHDVVLDPRLGVLYAGTEAGVFRRAGTTWTAESRGMPVVPVTDLVLGPRRSLVATTYGRSAFTTRLP